MTITLAEHPPLEVLFDLTLTLPTVTDLSRAETCNHAGYVVCILVDNGGTMVVEVKAAQFTT